MFWLLCGSRWKRFALLVSVPLMIIGCGDFDREGTGGTDDSGSRLIVEQIEPTYFDDATNQVDVIQGNCGAAGEEPDPEPYTDHYAVVTMTNRALNNATQQTASTVVLYEYRLSYVPVTVGSPPLPSYNAIDLEETVAMDPCEPGSASCPASEFTVELVPVREKEVLGDYLAANPTIFQLKYNVRYIFRGQNDFGEEVSVEGGTVFYATNYDNCGG